MYVSRLATFLGNAAPENSMLEYAWQNSRALRNHGGRLRGWERGGLRQLCRVQ
jgi:hypothetical protein